MFQSACLVEQGGPGSPVHTCRLDDGFGPQAAHLRYALRRVLLYKRFCLFPPNSAFANENFIYQSLFDDHVQHTVEQSRVCSRAQW